MKIGGGDMLSVLLGGYFKGTRKLIKSVNAYKGAAKIALKSSEETISLASKITLSPELKESWAELAAMEHFASATSEGGNTIGKLYGDDDGSWNTTFRFSKDFVDEIQDLYTNEFESSKGETKVNKASYIENKVQNHMQQMFENKKSDILNQVNK